jgi:glycosyltransferase involved in cell wall biosynthesis
LARTFSIITTCKGRLDHLKQSLPTMVGQGAKDVIVVDFSCPQGSGGFVSANFPSVRLVPVEGQKHFSNWKARNAGASAAGGDVLVFVDADTLLAERAIERLSESLPENAYGFFDQKTSRSFNRAGPRLAANQLKGFHAVPAEAFRRLGGYDEVLEGYAAGADTDLEDRLGMIGVHGHLLEPALVASVIEHDAASRTEHHAEPVKTSYCAGLLYRSAKRILLRMRREAELPLKTRQQLYEAARTAAQGLGVTADRVGMTFTLDRQPILMPRQLGYERGVQSLTLRVEAALEGKLDAIPE